MRGHGARISCSQSPVSSICRPVGDEPRLPFGHAIGLGQIRDGDLQQGSVAGGGKRAPNMAQEISPF
jgi:hypothetical protein